MANFKYQILSKYFILSVILMLASCNTYNKVGCRESAAIETYRAKISISAPKNAKIVLVGACFDIIHSGHIDLLKNASAQGDYLIVALEPDSRIIQKGRPAFHNQMQRAENLASLRYVDKILLLPELKSFDDYMQLVADVNPAVIAITNDDPQKKNKQLQAAKIGAKLIVVNNRIANLSSTGIYKSKQAIK